MKIDERLLAYKPISVTLNFDWDKMTYDERVLARHNYIEEQKKKDPNFVGYDFPDWFRSQYGTAANLKIKYYQDFTRVISTVGQIVGDSRGKLITTFGLSDKAGYMRSKLKRGAHRIDIAVHRILGCTFIPIPESMKKDRYKLVINHKNDVKNCNLKSNLEWNTQMMNIHNALKTGATPSSCYKMVVKLPGPLFNKEYYFSGMREIESIGFQQASISLSVITGRQHFHCNWFKIEPEELKLKEIGISQETLSILLDPKYGTSGSQAMVGTIVTEGPCKGERFCFFGSTLFEKQGFFYTTACKISKQGKGTHRGCTFVSMTREEAVNIPIGLTEAQKEHIFGKCK